MKKTIMPTFCISKKTIVCMDVWEHWSVKHSARLYASFHPPPPPITPPPPLKSTSIFR